VSHFARPSALDSVPISEHEPLRRLSIVYAETRDRILAIAAAFGECCAS